MVRVRGQPSVLPLVLHPSHIPWDERGFKWKGGEEISGLTLSGAGPSQSPT